MWIEMKYFPFEKLYLKQSWRYNAMEMLSVLSTGTPLRSLEVFFVFNPNKQLDKQ